jgi:hypothetical protein
MNINELKEKNLRELVEIGGDLDVADARDMRKDDLVERILLRDRHPRHRGRGLRLHAPPRPDAQPG